MKYRKNIYFANYLCLVVLLGSLCSPAWSGDIENRAPDTSTQDGDPFEYYNRKVFAFNNTLDKTVLRPLTVVYSTVIPKLITTRISSFIDLWTYPLDVVNYALQGEWEKSSTALVKFTVSVILTAGTSDAGEYIEDPHYESTSLNATLASFGIGMGPYIVVPFFGSGSTRTMVSSGISAFAFTPLTTQTAEAIKPISVPIANNLTYLEKEAVQVLNTRSKYIGADKAFENTSLDYYSTIRTILLTSERQSINGKTGEPVGIENDDLEDLDDSDDDLKW